MKSGPGRPQFDTVIPFGIASCWKCTNCENSPPSRALKNLYKRPSFLYISKDRPHGIILAFGADKVDAVNSTPLPEIIKSEN
jgi:hypothetical protein